MQHGTQRRVPNIIFLTYLVETGNLLFTQSSTHCNCNCPIILFSSSELFGGFYGSEKHAKFYSAGVVCAFEHLHERHIIYRDLKPENLLLNEKGHLKVTGTLEGKGSMFVVDLRKM